MYEIKHVKYNKMHCTKCGEFTVADLVGFDFSRVFAKAIELQNDETWKPLVRLDLKFYYTLRDICQEFNFQIDHNGPSSLDLTVGEVIKQLEFLMKPVTFKDIQESDRDTVLYNKLYEIISSDHGLPDEKMDDIEMLIRNLSIYKKEEVIVSVPVSFIFAKDNIQNEIPVGIKYYINDEELIDNNRVCPNCGTPFDNQSGFHHEFIIGLAGLSRVGKTAYIASLVHRLKQLKDDDFISISVKEDDEDSFYKFDTEIVSVYEKGQIINKTEVQNEEAIPLVYVSVKINNEDFNFVFVDMPGEIYDSEDSEGIDFISEKRHVLKSADAIWCCIEPSMIDDKYHNSNMEGIKAKDSNDQLENLVTTLSNLFVSKIPACVIVTQSDLLKDDYPLLFRPNVNVMEEYIQEDHTLDLTKTNDYVKKTRKFVKNMINFEATIEDVFEGFSMFAIASYGFDLSDSHSEKKIRPSMVELPFLWTLANLKCIGISQSKIGKNLFGKEKEIRETVVGRQNLYINGGNNEFD